MPVRRSRRRRPGGEPGRSVSYPLACQARLFGEPCGLAALTAPPTSDRSLGRGTGKLGHSGRKPRVRPGESRHSIAPHPRPAATPDVLTFDNAGHSRQLQVVDGSHPPRGVRAADRTQPVRSVRRVIVFRVRWVIVNHRAFPWPAAHTAARRRAGTERTIGATIRHLSCRMRSAASRRNPNARCSSPVANFARLRPRV